MNQHDTPYVNVQLHLRLCIVALKIDCNEWTLYSDKRSEIYQISLSFIQLVLKTYGT
jgi:hypothetical protein